MSDLLKCSYSKSFTITQIDEDQFLIEGSNNKIKIVGENEYAISYIDFDGGPLVYVGGEFLGRGLIKSIEIVNIDNKNYAMIKITLRQKKEK